MSKLTAAETPKSLTAALPSSVKVITAKTKLESYATDKSHHSFFFFLVVFG
jgi:hypothetical protein